MYLKRVLLLVSSVGLLTACPQSGVVPGPTPTPGPTPGQPEPYSVTGVAVDTQGRPIAGAKVWIDRSLTFASVVEVMTDSSGRYLVTGLLNEPYYARAWTQVDYNGERFCLRLGMPNPSDYDAFTPEVGVVRNFQWQLTGVIEDLREYDGYFGGEVQLFADGDMRGGEVELTFTPTAPLIDGSTGQTLTRTINVNEELSVYDIPIGTYRVTSALLENGVRTPLKTGTESSLGGYEGQTDAAEFAFKPYGTTCGNSNGADRA